MKYDAMVSDENFIGIGYLDDVGEYHDPIPIINVPYTKFIELYYDKKFDSGKILVINEDRDDAYQYLLCEIAYIERKFEEQLYRFDVSNGKWNCIYERTQCPDARIRTIPYECIDFDGNVFDASAFDWDKSVDLDLAFDGSKCYAIPVQHVE